MLTFIARVGYVVVVLLALVGLLSVATRFADTVQYLADPNVAANPDPPGAAGFQGRYREHPYLTLTHLAAGFLFMVLGPVQFWPAVRNRFLGYHRWSGRVWMIASLIGAGSAIVFVDRLPVFGNLSANIAVVIGTTLFVASLAQGYRAIRRRDITRHREWMIRAMAIGLGISTFRVLIPLLMLPPIRAPFTEAWNTVTWLGFVVNLTVAEMWINVTRRQPRVVPSPVSRRELSLPAVSLEATASD